MSVKYYSNIKTYYNTILYTVYVLNEYSHFNYIKLKYIFIIHVDHILPAYVYMYSENSLIHINSFSN